MTHAFVDPQLKLVGRVTAKSIQKSHKTVHKKFIVHELLLI